MYFSIAVKHIIAQLLYPVQRSVMQEFQESASFVHQSRFSAHKSGGQQLTSGAPIIRPGKVGNAYPTCVAINGFRTVHA